MLGSHRVGAAERYGHRDTAYMSPVNAQMRHFPGWCLPLPCGNLDRLLLLLAPQLPVCPSVPHELPAWQGSLQGRKDISFCAEMGGGIMISTPQNPPRPPSLTSPRPWQSGLWRFKPQLCCLQTMWPWLRASISLSMKRAQSCDDYGCTYLSEALLAGGVS